MDIFKPIQLFADLVTYQWLQFPHHSYWGDTLNFFIYDTIKIGILLIAINYLMAAIRYYFPVEKVRDTLAKRRWYGLNYLLAALLGVITPFCSCSSIPLFIGFVGAGIPLGVTFAFLIASPLVSESSLFLFPSMFGLKTTILYNAIGVIVAIVGGFCIERLKMEKYVRQELLKFASRHAREQEETGNKISPRQLLSMFWKDGMQITKSIFPYVVLGVGIGAVIHGFVPVTFVERYLSTKAWWAIPFAAISGAPIYANSVSVIPIIESLIHKGVPIGTALTFMTATVTISIPEFMILKKVMKWQLLATFFGITVLGIIVMGYVLNWVGQ